MMLLLAEVLVARDNVAKERCARKEEKRRDKGANFRGKRRQMNNLEER